MILTKAETLMTTCNSLNLMISNLAFCLQYDNLILLSQKEGSLQLHAGNHKYKDKDLINSVKSSLKSHTLWLSLFEQ